MSIGTILSKCLPFLLVILSLDLAVATEAEDLNLRYVRDVRVVVGSMPPDLRNVGMRSHLLKAEVESILRTAGIDLNEESRNCLEVGIAGIRARNDGFYVFSLRVKLGQPMVPLSIAQGTGPAQGNPEPLERQTVVSYTWDSGVTGYFRLHSDPLWVVREALFQKVDEFVQDLRMAKLEGTVPSTGEDGSYGENTETTPPPFSNNSSDGIQLISIKNEGAAIVVFDASGSVIHRTALPTDTSRKSGATRTELVDRLSGLGAGAMSTWPVPSMR